MRRDTAVRTKLLAALFLLLWASPSWATYALVSGQAAQVNNSGSLTGTATLTNNPTSGNLVVAIWCVYTAVGSLPITDFVVRDGAGTPNTYTDTPNPILASTVLSNDTYCGASYLVAGATANKAITLTVTAATVLTIDMWVAEFSGNASSSLVNIDAGNATGIGTAMVLPTLTTTVNGILMVGIGFPSFNVTSANSPFTGIGSISGVTAAYAEYFVQSTAGAQGINFTQDTSANYIGYAAAFNPAGGGGGAMPHLRLTKDVGQ